MVEFPIPWSIPSKPKIQHDIKTSNKKPKQNQTMLLTYQTNGTAAPEGISPNNPKILRHILPSYHILRKKTHPDPGNQWWVLLKMLWSHSKNNYKTFTRVIKYRKSSPRPKKLTTSCSSSWKCNTYGNQGSEKNQLGTLPDIWPNWKYIFWPYWEISSSIRQRQQLYHGCLPILFKIHPHHSPHYSKT